MELEQQKLARRKAITKVALISAVAILCSDMAMAGGEGAASAVAKSSGGLLGLADDGLKSVLGFLQTTVARVIAIAILLPFTIKSGLGGGSSPMFWATGGSIAVLAFLPKIAAFIGG